MTLARNPLALLIPVLLVLATALSLWALSNPAPAQGATLTVTSTADGGPGSLRQAIADAAPGDTIDFAVTGAITLTSGTLSISKNLTISGPGAATLSIDGNASSRVFNFSSGTISLSGLTLTNGSDSFGAAFKIQSGTLTITDSAISGNLTGGGVADIEVSGTARVTLINTTVSGNSSGGVQGAHDATVTLINSTVTGNSRGGVRADHDSTVTLINTTVTGNSSFGILHASSQSNWF